VGEERGKIEAEGRGEERERGTRGLVMLEVSVGVPGVEEGGESSSAGSIGVDRDRLLLRIEPSLRFGAREEEAEDEEEEDDDDDVGEG